MGAILGTADTPALALPQLQGIGASSTAVQTLLVQNELMACVTITLAPTLCPTRGREGRKPLQDDTESLALPSKTRGCFSKASLPGWRGALGAVPKVTLTTRSTATTSIPTPTPSPRVRKIPGEGQVCIWLPPQPEGWRSLTHVPRGVSGPEGWGLIAGTV